MTDTAQEVRHAVTKEDVDKFLANVLASHAADYHEKLSLVAQRRLSNRGPLVPAGLVNCMALLLADLEAGKDGFDAKAYMPTTPGISLSIPPAMYPVLWKHLPEDFVAELKKECENMPAMPPGCSVM